MTKEFIDNNLIINDRLEEYDGTTAVVATRFLSAEEVEYERWRAERWIKARACLVGMWANLYWLKMLLFTFRGTRLKSLFGFESSRDVFKRYKALRAVERAYL